MNRDFLVPDLGEGLQDATITSWNVAVGDTVALNQTLCTVETNKAQVEIPSPYEGRVMELGGAAGATLDVGSLLIRIDTADGAAAAADTAADSATDATAASATAATQATTTADTPRKPVLVGYGTDDSMDSSRRAVRPRAKPPVRKLAADLHVDLTGLAPGSGPDGIVTRDDVLSAAGGAELIDVHGVQAAMARRMALSHSEIPDASARVEVDCTALLELRDRLRATGPDLPITPFILTLRMVVIALSQHTVLNSTWVETTGGPQIHRQPEIHLGFGVAAPRGLLVPVVQDAHRLTTRALAAEVTRLAKEARAGTLTPGELAGSTFTVSNFGALGIDDGIPVINFPEAAILGMGSLKARPVVIGDAVVVRQTMPLTCVFDHRIADGALAGAFLGELRRLLEAPELALLDL